MDKNNILLQLFLTEGLGRKKIDKIIKKTNNLESVDLIHSHFPGILIDNELVDQTRQVKEYCYKNDIKIITIFDNQYPDSWKKYEDRPLLLFCSGNINLISSKCEKSAVIGTRYPKKSNYNLSEHIAAKLSSYNHIIVSGLAKGCDTAGHYGALKNKGKTIACFPSGLDNIYPPENTKLAQEIINCNGLLLSEYFPYEKAKSYKFAERDRIQALLSDQLFITECKKDSGTMITVDYAIKYNKQIFCNNLSSGNNSGCKYLLEKNIARPLTNYNNYCIIC
jgi:DNA processing protein